MFRKSVIRLLVLFFLYTPACQSPADKPIILVSREYDQRFIYWPALGQGNARMVDMYTLAEDSVDHYLSLASGIIISGGPDIDPAIYGKGSEAERCGNLDKRRDSLEMKMIRYAMVQKIPLLCICRGHQMLNAFSGGSLIVDIPADVESPIEHGKGSHHTVYVVDGTLLSSIVKLDSGRVNSSHHQAVESPAPGFRVSAFAPDGIIEAIEPVDTSGHPFILGVQWHPETMIRESQSPFTLAIARRFMQEVRATRR